MTLLWSLLAITLPLMGPMGVRAAHAGSSLPSPTKRIIIVHAIAGGSDAVTIDADTAALLDEAAQTGNSDGAFILLKPAADSAGLDSDPTRTRCQGEAMRAYLADHGIDQSRIRVDMQEELSLPLVSRSTCESGARHGGTN